VDKTSNFDVEKADATLNFDGKRAVAA